jgi:hypothetical protein
MRQKIALGGSVFHVSEDAAAKTYRPDDTSVVSEKSSLALWKCKHAESPEWISSTSPELSIPSVSWGASSFTFRSADIVLVTNQSTHHHGSLWDTVFPANRLLQSPSPANVTTRRSAIARRANSRVTGSDGSRFLAQRVRSSQSVGRASREKLFRKSLKSLDPADFLLGSSSCPRPIELLVAQISATGICVALSVIAIQNELVSHPRKVKSPEHP